MGNLNKIRIKFPYNTYKLTKSYVKRYNKNMQLCTWKCIYKVKTGLHLGRVKFYLFKLTTCHNRSIGLVKTYLPTLTATVYDQNLQGLFDFFLIKNKHTKERRREFWHKIYKLVQTFIYIYIYIYKSLRAM